MKTEKVLFTIELILLITFPLILYIFYKAYTSKSLEWDFVKEAALYINQLPNIHSYSACFFLFLGVGNLFIFNRFFTKKQNYKWKHIALIALISTLTLCTTYFIPIGFNGFENIDKFVYPWITTSDSLRMEFFMIERVLFVFLLFYLGIAFISILIHWHVSIEFLKYVFNFDKIQFKGVNVGKYIPIPIFIGTSLYFVLEVNEYQLFRVSSFFYNTLIFLFPLLIILFIFIKRSMKNAKQAKQN